MEIKTKANIEDIVFYMNGRELVKLKVKEIKIEATKNAEESRVDIRYSFYNKSCTLYEERICLSKEELIDLIKAT